MLYCISDFRPLSSPDPFGATLSPGEGIGAYPTVIRAIRHGFWDKSMFFD